MYFAHSGLICPAAQAWNHDFYWRCMKPNGGGKPSRRLEKLFEDQFGSFDNFRTEFATAGNTAFGSGWAWLAQDESKKLQVYKTIGADNPLVRNHVRNPVAHLLPLLLLLVALLTMLGNVVAAEPAADHGRVGARVLPGLPEPEKPVRGRLP
jgi:superoxide dismutase